MWHMAAPSYPYVTHHNTSSYPPPLPQLGIAQYLNGPLLKMLTYNVKISLLWVICTVTMMSLWSDILKTNYVQKYPLRKFFLLWPLVTINSLNENLENFNIISIYYVLICLWPYKKSICDFQMLWPLATTNCLLQITGESGNILNHIVIGLYCRCGILKPIRNVCIPPPTVAWLGSGV